MEIFPNPNLHHATPVHVRSIPVPEAAPPATRTVATSERTPVPQSAPAEKTEAPSAEEQAIRAAFQAQLSMSDLLNVVRDPADVLLPDAPVLDGR